MMALKRLAVALAAGSIFATTSALPTSSSDIVSSLGPKDTANSLPPTACTVEENAVYDNYGITVPIAYSAYQCTKARDAVADLTTGFEDAWVCQPYGDWTILIFSAKKGAAKQVDSAMAEVFTRFAFQCASSEGAGDSSVLSRDGPAKSSTLVKKGDPIAVGAQSCGAQAHGAYNTYHVRIGEPFDKKRCELFHGHLYIKMVSVRQFHCWEDGFGQTTSTFLATAYMAGSINSVAHDNWPEVNGLNCPDY